MTLSKPAIATGITLLSIFALFGWGVANYNSLVAQKADVDNAWAKVETQYQRRLDLIQNIVGSVKGAQKQERDVFGKIADARKQVVSNAPTDEKAAAASQSESTIVSIVPRLQEAYPDIKSDGQVSKLITQLETTENGIAKSRDAYNNTVTNYNVGVVRFPKSVFAGMFGFQKSNLYKADQGANKAPSVNFGE
jgi:LemA protein